MAPATELGAVNDSAPVHGIAWELIIGLIPALPISVAPSGTAPPLSLNAELAVGVESGDAAPIEETLADGEQGEIVDPTPANPPPSKAEAAPDALAPDIAESPPPDKPRPTVPDVPM
jgi:hypothetical protein